MMEKYIIAFNKEDLAVLDRALAVRPYAEVAPLIASINRQISEAIAAAAQMSSGQNDDEKS